MHGLGTFIAISAAIGSLSKELPFYRYIMGLGLRFSKMATGVGYPIPINCHGNWTSKSFRQC